VGSRFVDRREELEFLEEVVSRGAAQLVLVYGRRRVGKTRLLLEFLRGRKGLYFYVPRGGAETVLAELSRSVEGEFFKGFRFPSFPAFLEYLAGKLEQGYVVVLDEFQRLAEVEGALSLLQRYWDERFSRGRGVLVLSGSAIGAVHRVALRGDAPLYGRRTAVLKLEPLGFGGLAEWFTRYSVVDLVKVYGVFGGTPAYLELVDESLSPEENAVRLVLSKRGPLHEEPEFLLMEEFRAPERYMDILSAVAQGKSSLSEIAGHTGLRRENLTTYLASLELLGLIGKETPLLGRARPRYFIPDPFFAFWFRYVRPNMAYLEAGLEREVWASVSGDFDAYLGAVFEVVARELLVDLARGGELGFKPDKVGRWWSRGEEVDLVLYSSTEDKALCFEVKWSDLTQSEAERELRKLIEKARDIAAGEKAYGLVARRLQGKEALRSKCFYAYDAEDMQQHWRH
jgi:AAA+ ATPase superfamily predicted ATPase